MKPIQTIALSLLSAATILSCNNPSGTVAAKSVTSPKVIETAAVVPSAVSETITTSSYVSKGVSDNISAAKTSGKAVFLVVIGTGVAETDKAMLIAKGANDIYKNAVIVQMNRDDAANSQLVNEYRLAGAPLPLILVISSKGFPTGGYFLVQATSENLAALVPSPKLEDVYAAINGGKYVIVAFSKKTFTDKSKVLKECKKAVALLNNEAILIEVDVDDSKEANFLNQLRIDKSHLKASLTLVINKQGQVAGTATTVPDAKKLVAAAKKPVTGGCGPGCGPAGCGK